MMVVSAEAEIRTSLPCSLHAKTALTKSLWPWNLFPGFREEAFHDHIDLSQQPAKRVFEVGDIATDVRGAAAPEKVAEA